MGLLRGLFGPSKDEIWSQLSQEISADYQKGGFFTRGKVVLTHRQWEITLDIHTVHSGESSTMYTRMRAPFVNRGGFRFNIYRKGLFSGIGRLLGVQDIETGDAFFDEQFIIQGEPEHLVQQLLINAKIRQLIQDQPSLHLQVKDAKGRFGKKNPEGENELYFQTPGVIKDKERLKALFDLFSAVLDELYRMGSAYEQGPGVTPA